MLRVVNGDGRIRDVGDGDGDGGGVGHGAVVVDDGVIERIGGGEVSGRCIGDDTGFGVDRYRAIGRLRRDRNGGNVDRPVGIGVVVKHGDFNCGFFVCDLEGIGIGDRGIVDVDCDRGGVGGATDVVGDVVGERFDAAVVRRGCVGGNAGYVVDIDGAGTDGDDVDITGQ